MLASQWNQSLNPPVRPVCPEAPVWPVEPLAPASSHNSSYCVTCLLSSMESTGLAMPAYIWMESQSLNPPVRPVCPEAPVSPVEPLAPASSHNRWYCVIFLILSVEELMNCHACIHLHGKPEPEPTL